MNGLNYFFLFLLFTKAFSCESEPAPYAVMALLDLDYKGYASPSDYQRVYKDSKIFAQIDVDKNQQVSVKEIHLAQEAYQAKCLRVQDTK